MVHTKLSPTRRVNRLRAGRFYALEDGTELPSVTNILSAVAKPALLNWMANTEREMCIEAAANLYEDAPLQVGIPKMSRASFITTLKTRIGKEKAGKKLSDAACDIGSQVHALVEWNLRKQIGQVVGPEPRLTSDAAVWAFAAWERWRQSVKLEPLWIEQTVYSRTHGYAGTLDLAASMLIEPYGEVFAVLDWKTGKAVYCEALLQNAAYAQAYVEMGHATEMPVGLIVRLPKTETDPQFEAKVIPSEDQPRLFDAFLSVKNTWTFLQRDREEREAVRTEDKAATA